MNSTFSDCGEKGISHCRKVVFAVLSLAIILLAVYGNSFDCAWQFDDEPNITDNPNLHMTSWHGNKSTKLSNPIETTPISFTALSHA
jgi:hypothetical protein